MTKRILENDGKNLLQLKAARIHRYLEKIVFVRLSSCHQYGTLSPWFNDVKLDTLTVWVLWASIDRGEYASDLKFCRKSSHRLPRYPPESASVFP